MPNLPSRHQQLITMHAAFICQVVQFGPNKDHQDEYNEILKTAAKSGWPNLVQAIRKIVKGERELNKFKALDEEDQIIAESIMRGLQNPATLPDPNAKADPSMAVPGLASMIQAAASGQADALILTANMAEQMAKAKGPMAELASVIRPIINGERDSTILCKGKSQQSQDMIRDILDTLESASPIIVAGN